MHFDDPPNYGKADTGSVRGYIESLEQVEDSVEIPGVNPDAIVLVATVRALKLHGGSPPADLAIPCTRSRASTTAVAASGPMRQVETG